MDNEDYIRLSLPLKKEEREGLNAGDKVLLSGVILTARDAAHMKMADEYEKTGEFPINLNSSAIYYCGISPAPKGEIVGAAGPTTAGRVDSVTPLLINRGLKVMIGKGNRSKEVIDAMVKNKAVYFAATGGAGALIAKCILSVKNIAYPFLGPEAINALEIADLPLIVAIDCNGKNYYEIGPKKYKSKVNNVEK